ncbi:sodium/potassium/calcium exchanger 3-like [Ptychodera flava]|uniref:sodium/potassium/calcium exchanger 3-like n=1 Tax=Ptychodera flava TaxID=63121 RepID=UPI00396A202B
MQLNNTTGPLSAELECLKPPLDSFPPDLFTEFQRRHGAVVFHIAMAAYLTYALILLCYHYFVPSLRCICKKLDIPPEVAGATFMAAGCSASGLVISSVGVFVVKDNIGMSAIIGECAFSMLFLIGLCGVCAKTPLPLSWGPMLRNSLYFLLAVVALVVVVYDDKVFWYEAICMLIIYTSYVLVVICLRKWSICSSNVKTSESEMGEGRPISSGTEKTEYDALKGGDGEDSDTNVDGDVTETAENKEDSSSGDFKPFKIPVSGFCRGILWFTSLPVYCVLFLTVPDCRTERWSSWFIVTFLMSTVWIMVFSYILVWMVIIIGYTFLVREEAVGLTLLVVAISAPDLISSIMVARAGFGDMAVSNLMGANIFIILVGLGLPWFIQTVILAAETCQAPALTMRETGLTYVTVMLLGSTTVGVLIVAINKWKLDKKTGLTLMALYLAFVVGALAYELNVLQFEFCQPQRMTPIRYRTNYYYSNVLRKVG